MSWLRSPSPRLSRTLPRLSGIRGRAGGVAGAPGDGKCMEPRGVHAHAPGEAKHQSHGSLGLVQRAGALQACALQAGLIGGRRTADLLRRRDGRSFPDHPAGTFPMIRTGASKPDALGSQKARFPGGKSPPAGNRLCFPCFFIGRGKKP